MKKNFLSITALFAIAIVCHAQANTKLSNLAPPTAINVPLIPGGATGSKNFGTINKHWKNGYFDATVYGYGVGSDYGIYGASSLYGVYGSGRFGVYASGRSEGVYGSGSDYGLFGSSSNIGAYGEGPIGVYGTGSGSGVYGFNTGSGQGVFGYEAGDGAGTHGEAFGSNGWGAYGYSSQSYGLYATTDNSSSYAG